MLQPETRVGFTGTRRGMTPYQRETVRRLITGYDWLHHGDCVGADAEAHELAAELGIKTAVHPPTNAAMRAFCAHADLTFPPRGYLGRDRDIVDHTSRLVAVPEGLVEEVRSGTWATARYARNKGRSVTLVMPDGSVVSWGRILEQAV